MEKKKEGGLLTKALENPRATNGFIAAFGALMLIVYATLTTIHQPLPIAGLITLSESAVKAIAIFFKEVGLAAMVAVIINFSIEAFNRKRHDVEKKDLIDTINSAHASQAKAQIKAINEEIFRTVFERDIPRNFFKAIEEQMLRSSFLRTDSNYSLSIAPEGEDHALITFRHEYKIKNISASTTSFPMQAEFDVIKHLKDKYKIKVFQAGRTQLTGDELKPTPQDKTDMHEWWSIRTSQSLEPNEVIDCIVEFVRVSPKTGKEAICSMLPTERMSIRVYDRDRKFSVRAMSLHPRPEIERQIDEAEGIYHWELDGALFPGQGFLIDWMPRR